MLKLCNLTEIIKFVLNKSEANPQKLREVIELNENLYLLLF